MFSGERGLGAFSLKTRALTDFQGKRGIDGFRVKRGPVRIYRNRRDWRRRARQGLAGVSGERQGCRREPAAGDARGARGKDAARPADGITGRLRRIARRLANAFSMRRRRPGRSAGAPRNARSGKKPEGKGRKERKSPATFRNLPEGCGNASGGPGRRPREGVGASIAGRGAAGRSRCLRAKGAISGRPEKTGGPEILRRETGSPERASPAFVRKVRPESGKSGRRLAGATGRRTGGIPAHRAGGRRKAKRAGAPQAAEAERRGFPGPKTPGGGRSAGNPEDGQKIP